MLKRNIQKYLAAFMSVLMLFGMLTGCQKKQTLPTEYEPIAPLEFPKLNWGLSPEQVNAVYPGIERAPEDPNFPSEESMYLVYEGEAEVYGYPATVQFTFVKGGDKLYLGSVKANWEEATDEQLEEIEAQITPQFDAYLEKLKSGELLGDIAKGAFSEEQQERYEKNDAYTGGRFNKVIRNVFTWHYWGSTTKHDYELWLFAGVWLYGNVQMYPDDFEG